MDMGLDVFTTTTRAPSPPKPSMPSLPLPDKELLPRASGPQIQVRLNPLTNAEGFTTYCSRFNDWAKATNGNPNYLTFLSLIQCDALYNKLHQITLPADIIDNHQSYTAFYIKHLASTKQTTNQHKLLTLKQLPSETVEKYAERVETIMYKCTDDMFTNKTLGYNAFISGILDKSIKQKLYESEISEFTPLVEKAIRLDSARAIIETSEPSDQITFAATSAPTQQITPTPNTNPSYAAHPMIEMRPRYIQQRTNYSPRGQTNHGPQGQTISTRTCFNCGKSNHLVHKCRAPLDYNKIPQKFWYSLQRQNNGQQFFRAPQPQIRQQFQPQFQTQFQPQFQQQFQSNQGQSFIPNSTPIFRSPGPQ